MGIARRRPGFTLIELLVVISVIMLLAALALPVLQRAATVAREVKCTSNVAQITKSLTAYGVTYDSHMPNLLADARSTEMYRVSYLARIYYAGTRPVGLGLILSLGYVADPNSLVCPVASPSTRFNTPSNPARDGIPMRTSYMYNYFPPKGTPSAHGELQPPEGMTFDDVQNLVPGDRPEGFTAVIADSFHGWPHSHSSRGVLCVGYTDGGTKRLHMTRADFNYDEDLSSRAAGAWRYSYSRTGYERTRDAWVMLSGKRNR